MFALAEKYIVGRAADFFFMDSIWIAGCTLLTAALNENVYVKKYLLKSCKNSKK